MRGEESFAICLFMSFIRSELTRQSPRLCSKGIGDCHSALCRHCRGGSIRAAHHNVCKTRFSKRTSTAQAAIILVSEKVFKPVRPPSCETRFRRRMIEPKSVAYAVCFCPGRPEPAVRHGECILVGATNCSMPFSSQIRASSSNFWLADTGPSDSGCMRLILPHSVRAFVFVQITTYAQNWKTPVLLGLLCYNGRMVYGYARVSTDGRATHPTTEQKRPEFL